MYGEMRHISCVRRVGHRYLYTAAMTIMIFLGLVLFGPVIARADADMYLDKNILTYTETTRYMNSYPQFRVNSEDEEDRDLKKALKQLSRDAESYAREDSDNEVSARFLRTDWKSLSVELTVYNMARDEEKIFGYNFDPSSGHDQTLHDIYLEYQIEKLPRILARELMNQHPEASEFTSRAEAEDMLEDYIENDDVEFCIDEQGLRFYFDMYAGISCMTVHLTSERYPDLSNYWMCLPEDRYILPIEQGRAWTYPIHHGGRITDLSVLMLMNGQDDHGNRVYDADGDPIDSDGTDADPEYALYWEYGHEICAEVVDDLYAVEGIYLMQYGGRTQLLLVYYEELEDEDYHPMKYRIFRLAEEEEYDGDDPDYEDEDPDPAEYNGRPERLIAEGYWQYGDSIPTDPSVYMSPAYIRLDRTVHHVTGKKNADIQYEELYLPQIGNNDYCEALQEEIRALNERTYDRVKEMKGERTLIDYRQTFYVVKCDRNAICLLSTDKSAFSVEGRGTINMTSFNVDTRTGRRISWTEVVAKDSRDALPSLLANDLVRKFEDRVDYFLLENKIEELLDYETESICWTMTEDSLQFWLIPSQLDLQNVLSDEHYICMEVSYGENPALFQRGYFSTPSSYMVPLQRDVTYLLETADGRTVVKFDSDGELVRGDDSFDFYYPDYDLLEVFYVHNVSGNFLYVHDPLDDSEYYSEIYNLDERRMRPEDLYMFIPNYYAVPCDPDNLDFVLYDAELGYDTGGIYYIGEDGPVLRAMAAG